MQWPPGSFEKRDISVIFMDHLHNCPECLCSGFQPLQRWILGTGLQTLGADDLRRVFKNLFETLCELGKVEAMSTAQEYLRKGAVVGCAS